MKSTWKNSKVFLIATGLTLVGCSANQDTQKPSPELPSVTVPPVSAPSVAAPSVSAPSVSAPSVSAPSVAVPSPSLSPSPQETESHPASEGNRYFYSFARSNPSDPVGMMNFGVNQTSQVNESISTLTKNPFEMDTELDPLVMNSETLQGKFAELRAKLKPEDTFVLYSHSHGLIPGLGMNWDAANRMDIPYKWQTFAQEIISLPAKNVIIFTMSCHSGYLAEALNTLSSEWKNKRSSAGRNLIVLTAVSKEQLATATDNGMTLESIGNPFTYAVKTALRGAADGFGGKPKDGKTTMQELVSYVLATAKSQSADQYAEPQNAGEFTADDVFLP
ncbi:MAG: hypothetical protein RIR26_1678 [Pseudomonadota bacterium]